MQRLLPLIACCALTVPLLFSGSVRAFTVDQDYYAPREPGLLGSAEIQHLQRGINEMQKETRAGSFNYQGAFGDFKYILDYFPNHPRALALASDLAIRAKQPQWIEPYFQKSLTLYPQHAYTHVIFGTYLQKRGKVQDAIAEYTAALKLDANQVDAHYNLGLAYLAQRDLVKANIHAQKAYSLGAPFPGLRDKLTQAGAWKESADEPQPPKAKND